MDITIPITLIVKAPNQQIEDQTVKCELSWTIQKLKTHLAEVYPSKPARDEQKLIYSGQLLSDTVILKDVLRNYDGQDTHTVHLVCTPSRKSEILERMQQQQQPKPKVETPQQSSSSSEASASSSSTSTVSDGLRHRTTSTPQVNQNTVPDFRHTWTTMSQLEYNSNVLSPSQYAMQVALFQQAYAQYIHQYMQMMTNQLPPRPVSEPEPERVPAAAAAPAPAAQQQAPLNVADFAPNQAAAGNNQMDQGDEPQADRDWLDWFYILSRVLVLFCIVYFYSSPLRFTLVLLLGIVLYLYQMGFLFRVQPAAAPAAADAPVRQQPENNNVMAGAPAPQPIPQNGNDATTIPGGDALPNVTVPADNVEQRPTVLNIMWTFFTTFFASLIPEIPNAV